MTDPKRLSPLLAWFPLFCALVALAFSIVTWAQTPSPPPPLTLADAEHRATDDLQQILKGAFDGPWRHYTLQTGPDPAPTMCREPGGLTINQWITTKSLVLRDIDPARLGNYLLVLRAWLPVYGWDIRTNIYEPRDRYIVAATRDGYLLTAHTDTDGVLTLDNSSPCANPS